MVEEAATNPELDDLQIRIVVGLGNPGPRYTKTRHNIGFVVLNQVADSFRGRWRQGSQCEVAQVEMSARTVSLVKPLTFMNRSGEAVTALRRDIGFDPAEVLVVCDDFQLPFSRLRLRRRGGDGGHNGLASVLQDLDTEEVPRLRLGIGPVPAGAEEIDFVLREFAPDEPLPGLVDRGSLAVQGCVDDGLDSAMNRFNGSGAL